MEAVKSFNAELSSLYEVKPPISKAKMTALTRGAIKAIKFYKHVVQSVEKFILKCKPEYKVPGLYVIDSIVRQSRHQFGSEKDVFAPRFSKNLLQTFINLFKCPVEDKSKIIRVLNLWQKNQVFLPEIIQPLFDLADPNNPIYQQLQQQNTPVQPANGSQQQQIKGSPALQRTPTKNSLNQSSTSEVSSAPNLNLPEPSVFQQLQQLQRFFQQEADSRPEVHFDRKLLDFDYGDDEDEVNPSPRAPLSTATSSADPVASLLKVPEVLRKLQTLQNTLAAGVNTSTMESDLDRQRKLQEMKMQEDEFDKHLAQTVPNLPFAAECDFKITQNNMMSNLHFMPPPPEPQIGQGFEMMPRENNVIFNNNNKNNNNNNNSQNDVEVITLDHEDSYSDEDRYKRKRSRSRSRDRGRDKDRRRRSRSRSRSRRRHRSKSRERKDKDKKEKERESEKDKERKRRGLPVMRNNHLSVCSTTLWVGHLSKLVHQDDLSNTFGEFGDVVSIDLIIPRGCAFIVMHRRQDATRCLAKLRNHNLHGKCITLAWAPGKGVKGKDLKDYWEGDLGVSYIPWSKVKEDIDLEALEDGGMIDEDTMPEWMKMKVEQNIQKKIPDAPTLVINRDGSNQSIDTSQPPPLPPTSLLQSQMLSMVNPFQLNNRFLGMLPNLPLGVPPPNMAPPPNMLQNLGLGIGSPFQNAAGFMPPQLPQPPQQQQQQEMKHSPPLADSKLRNLSESLMSLAGQPLTMPPQLPLNHPPPPLHSLMDDNMDVDMEDAVSLDLNKPPPLIPLSEQLQSSMNIMSNFNRDNRHGDNNHRFSPDNNIRHERRDRSNDRGGGGRRRSRSRERGRGGDRRDRDRDFGRGGRDRGDRRNFERWNSYNRRDDRHNNKNGRGRDRSYERKQGNTRRDSNSKDGNEQREKSLNDRLREMAGHKFDYSEGGGGENNKISPSADSKNETAQIPPEGVEDSSVAPTLEDKTDEFSSSQDIEECSENRNAAAAAADDEEQEEDNMMFPNPPPLEEEVPNFDMMRVERFRHDDGNFPPPNEGGPYGHFVGFDDERHFNNRDEFEDDIPGGGFNHRFDGRPYPPDFRDELQFGDDGFGPPPLPPPSLLLDGPPGYPDFGPDRFMRNGRRGGRGGRGGRDGPEFFPRDEFIPPMMDDGGGFGPPLRNDFVPPPLRDDFNQRGGIRIRGRAFFAPRGNSFRDSPPGFNRDFDGAPPPPPLDFFRGGGGGGSGRGRNFMDFRGRGGGRGGGFRSNNNRNRSEFFDGPPAPTDFFDGPPGVPPVLDELLSLPSSVGGSSEEFVDARRENRKRNSRSRWENEEDSNNKETVAAVAAAAPVVAASAESEEVNNEDAAAAAAAAEEVENDGGDATPLRDEIDDCDGGAGVEGEFPLAEAVPAASAAPVVAEISQNSTENDGIIVQNENIVSEQQQQNNNANNDETAEELK